MSKFIIALIAIVFSLGSMYASGVSITASADSAYNSRDYTGAIRQYEDIIAKHGVSAAMLYNLGNAYSRSGDYGMATLNYLRCLRIDPGNSKARANLNFIEERVAEANKGELKGKKFSFSPDSEPFFSRVSRSIKSRHLSDTWSVWSVVCFLGFIACVALYLFTTPVLIRKTGFFASIIFFTVSVVFLIFAFMAGGYVSDEAVVTSAKVHLMAEPSLNSKENPVALHKGTIMKITDTWPDGVDTPEWYKVRLNSDFNGWLPASQVSPVDIH
ncbi:MAG: tetratricopeptide repeat protein [Muribaculaceae bacterium]|nr:tetratricopeptide repeat protein [Muribaculaceae bacterium]